ncbi:archaellin/type IV pilin N-terminal domain-containing protein [Halobacteriaceae archaeon SHR40]|uniref:archaellin/type IV pilin N-terminal domain-containing protein n=1 Tax=Halovenus amylolytica TaxID=2500550 RepID=UPI000FE2C3C0
MIRDALTDDRGQVGIGTLIVFIALVLVAAIAAGVLINTAGFLQTQSEQTGEESTSQVANNINVIGEVGEVNASLDTINRVRLTVQRSPGSDNVDLSELSIQYVGDNGFANYVHATQGDDTDDLYYLNVITSDSDDAVMTEDSDRYQIVIPFGNASTGPTNFSLESDDPTSGDSDFQSGGVDSGLSDMETGEEAELEITTADRATRNAFIEVPDTIESDESEVTL